MKSNLKMKLANIQVNLKAKKSRYNGFGKYNYRAAEDILEAIKPFLNNEKCTVIINEELISFDPPVLKSTASIYDAESDDAIIFEFICSDPGKYVVAANMLSRGSKARLSFFINGQTVLVASINNNNVQGDQLLEFKTAELLNGYNELKLIIHDWPETEGAFLGIDYLKFSKL